VADFTRALPSNLPPSGLGRAAERFACRGLAGPAKLLSDITANKSLAEMNKSPDGGDAT